MTRSCVCSREYLWPTLSEVGGQLSGFFVHGMGRSWRWRKRDTRVQKRRGSRRSIFKYAKRLTGAYRLNTLLNDPSKSANRYKEVSLSACVDDTINGKQPLPQRCRDTSVASSCGQSDRFSKDATPLPTPLITVPVLEIGEPPGHGGDGSCCLDLNAFANPVLSGALVPAKECYTCLAYQRVYPSTVPLLADNTRVVRLQTPRDLPQCAELTNVHAIVRGLDNIVQRPQDILLENGRGSEEEAGRPSDLTRVLLQGLYRALAAHPGCSNLLDAKTLVCLAVEITTGIGRRAMQMLHTVYTCMGKHNVQPSMSRLQVTIEQAQDCGTQGGCVSLGSCTFHCVGFGHICRNALRTLSANVEYERERFGVSWHVFPDGTRGFSIELPVSATSTGPCSFVWDDGLCTKRYVGQEWYGVLEDWVARGL